MQHSDESGQLLQVDLPRKGEKSHIVPIAAACKERCFDGVREVLNAMKVNRTLLCERESLTADVADLVPICTHFAKETLGMWLEDMAEMFEGGLQSEKDVEAEGRCQRYHPTISVFSTWLILPVVTYLSHSLPCLQLSCTLDHSSNVLMLAQDRLSAKHSTSMHPLNHHICNTLLTDFF